MGEWNGQILDFVFIGTLGRFTNVFIIIHIIIFNWFSGCITTTSKCITSGYPSLGYRLFTKYCQAHYWSMMSASVTGEGGEGLLTYSSQLGCCHIQSPMGMPKYPYFLIIPLILVLNVCIIDFQDSHHIEFNDVQFKFPMFTFHVVFDERPIN